MKKIVQQATAAKEEGQAIVFVAMFMIVLLGTLGLAIDGGGLFFLWRDAQNATDAATFAASFARCTGSNPDNIRNAGYEAAEKNGFVTNPSENIYVNVYPGNGTEQVDRNFDGVDDGQTEADFVESILPTGSKSDVDNFIFTEVRAEKPKYFIQLLYPGPLVVNPNATGYCNPGNDYSDFPGIVALAPSSCLSQGEFEFTGASAKLRSASGSNGIGTHSNGDTGIGGNAGGGSKGPSQVYVDVNSVGGNDYKSKQVEFNNGATANSGVNSRSDNFDFNWSDWAPGGRIFEAAPLATDLGSSTSVPSGAEGIYYYGGTSGVTISDSGPKGATIIAPNAQITGNGVQIEGYEWLKTANVDGYNPSYMVMASGKDDGSGNPFCSQGNGQAAIKVTGAFSAVGVVYAPMGPSTWSGNSSYFEGVMIGYNIDFSGSEAEFVINTTFLRPTPPKTSIAD